MGSDVVEGEKEAANFIDPAAEAKGLKQQFQQLLILELPRFSWARGGQLS